jgi:hypothetical protein
VVLFVLLCCSLAGVYRNLSLADQRTRAFREEVGSQMPFDELTSLRNFAIGFVKPDQKIYLELKTIHHKLRQIVSYFLWDVALASDWSDDVYLCGTPAAPLSSSTFLMKFLEQNDLRKTIPRFGNIVFTETPGSITRLKSVEGGYAREADDKGSWWHWTSNALHFQYEVDGTGKPASLAVRFKSLCRSNRSINVVIQGPESSKEFVIESQGGWQSYETEFPFSGKHLDICFTSSDPAERLSKADERMAKFLIKDLEVIPKQDRHAKEKPEGLYQ